jgi:hypothetical protein
MHGPVEGETAGELTVPVAREPASPRAKGLVTFGAGVGGMAAVVAGGVVVTVVLNTVTIPAAWSPRLVPLAIAVIGGMTALRWVRRAAKGELRAGAAAKVAEFGGGIYGSLAFATFLYLEAMDLVGDIAAAGSLWAFLSSLSVGWLIAQMVESVKFAVQAMMWPWYWFSELGAKNAAFIAGGVWALDGLRRGLAGPVARWRERRAGRGGVAASEETP